MSEVGRIALCVAVLALIMLAGRWAVRARDDSRRLPEPAVPPDPEAYELAYLRGGTRELARVIIVSLVERRHLVIGGSDKEPLIGRADGPPMDDLLDIERAVVVWCATWRKPKDIFEKLGLADQLEDYCAGYRKRLEEQHLLTPYEVKEHTTTVRWFGSMAVIAVVAIGLFPLRPPAHVLVWLVALVAPVLLFARVTEPPVASHRGRALIQRLRLAYRQLKAEPPTWAGGPHAAGALLIGIFGMGALAAAGVTEYGAVFSKASSSSGCGACGGCGGCGSCDSCGCGCGD